MPLELETESFSRAYGSISPDVDPLLDEQMEQENKERPPFLQTLKSSFLTENTIGSFITGNTLMPHWMDSEYVDLDFDRTPYITEKYLPFADQFIKANTEQEALLIQRSLDREIEHDLVRGQAGWHGIVTDIVAGTADPITWAPFLNGVKIKQGAKGGAKVLNYATEFGKAGFKGTAAQEAILQATQEGRSVAESSVNIASGTVLSGMLGGTFGTYLARNEFFNGAKDLETLDQRFFDEMADDSDDSHFITMDDIDGDGSAGAMSLQDVTLEDLELSDGAGIAKIMAKAPTLRPSDIENAPVDVIDLFNNPVMRVLSNSESKEAKIGLLTLAESPLRLKGHDKGTFVSPSNVRGAMRRDEAQMLVPTLVEIENGFKTYAKRLKDAGQYSGKITKDDFKTEVYMALNRGDKSEIPEVEQIAQTIRNKIFSPALEELRQAGFDLPDAPGKDLSYVMRNYNPRNIRARENDFIDALTEQFVRDIKKAEAEVQTGKVKERPSTQRKKIEAQATFDLAEVRTIAREVAQKIQGLPSNRPSSSVEFDLSRAYRGAGGAENLKSRSLQLDDDIVERLAREGFIDTDIERLVHRYVNTVMRDLRVTQKIGDLTGDKVGLRIRDEYNQKIDQLETAKKSMKDETEVKKADKRIRKLKKQRRSDLQDWYSMVAVRTGEYNAQQGKIASVTKNLNTMRLMGSMVESAMPDVARVGFAQASGPIFRQSLGTLKDAAFNRKKFKLSVDEARALATATDVIGSSRMASMADIQNDAYANANRGFTSTVSDFTNKFFTHIGANHWNELWETISSQMISSQAIKEINMLAKGQGNKKEIIAKLAEGGMTEAQAKLVAKMFKKHGAFEGDLAITNVHKWSPETLEESEAMNAYIDMVARDVERLIIQPDLDRSLFASKGVGSLIMQFKSFGNSSLMRATALYGQRAFKNPKDFRNHIAMVTQIAFGGVVASMKLYLLGLAGSTAWDRAKDWSNERWLLEAVDRSGVTGNITDIYNSYIQPTANFAGIPGLEPLTRYQQRGQIDRFFGPSMGLIDDTLTGVLPTVVRPLTGNMPTQAEIKAARRTLPYQNYIGLRYLLDGGMNTAFEELDIPKSRE